MSRVDKFFTAYDKCISSDTALFAPGVAGLSHFLDAYGSFTSNLSYRALFLSQAIVSIVVLPFRMIATTYHLFFSDVPTLTLSMVSACFHALAIPVGFLGAFLPQNLMKLASIAIRDIIKEKNTDEEEQLIEETLEPLKELQDEFNSFAKESGFVSEENSSKKNNAPIAKRIDSSSDSDTDTGSEYEDNDIPAVHVKKTKVGQFDSDD